jgi:hypothetical protein
VQVSFSINVTSAADFPTFLFAFEQPSKIKRGPFQKPPIRLALADLNDEPTSVSTVPSAVKVPRGHRKGQPSFQWTDKKFFVVVAEDEDGHHCAVSVRRHVCPSAKALV